MNEGWTEVALGSCYDLVSERYDSKNLPPEEAYFGLEHLDSAVPVALTGGKVAEVSGQVTAFRPSDTLFGRLRPYLRKVSYCAVTGYGSTEILVLRPRTDVVHPRFLHLLASSESVIGEAIAKSAGSRMPRTSASDLAAIPVPLPPLSVQRRIVDLMEHLDNQALRLKSEQRASADAYQALLAATLRSETGVDERPLAQVLRLDVDRQTVLPLQTYPMVGVANRGQGVFLSEEVPGTETKYAHLNRVASGQVVMRKLTAWEGPIAVVPPEAHGRYASVEFPTFTVDENVADIEFLSHLCRWPGLWERMKSRVTGTVQRRKRLNPDQLLSVQVPLPPLAQQKETARLLSDLWEVAHTLTTEEAALNELRGALLNVLLTGSLVLPDSYNELLGVAS